MQQIFQVPDHSEMRRLWQQIMPKNLQRSLKGLEQDIEYPFRFFELDLPENIKYALGRNTTTHVFSRAVQIMLDASCSTSSDSKKDLREEIVAEYRSVYVRGQNLEIVNTMIFPSGDSAIPLFVAELMIIQNRPMVAFVDIQFPGWSVEQNQQNIEKLQEILPRRDSIRSLEEPPLWASEFSGGLYYYRTRKDKIETTEAIDAYQFYLSAWYSWICDHRQEILAQKNPWHCPEEITKFKRHHRLETPANAWFDKMFSPEWCQQFMDGFLYR